MIFEKFLALFLTNFNLNTKNQSKMINNKKIHLYKNFYRLKLNINAKLEDKIIMFCFDSSLVCLLMRISDKY